MHVALKYRCFIEHNGSIVNLIVVALYSQGISQWWSLNQVLLYFLLQDVAKGLQDLLDYTGDVENDFCMNFQVN